MNRAAFDQLVRTNQEPLRRFLLNLCNGNSSLSDDLAQETFIKAYLNIGRFNGFSKFSTWLFRIGYNCYCDHLRQTQKAINIEINEKNAGFAEGSGHGGNHELYLALSKLKEVEKHVILLFYMEDKSIKEISKITGMPENTIKSHLSRAKSHLSEHLKNIGYERE